MKLPRFARYAAAADESLSPCSHSIPTILHVSPRAVRSPSPSAIAVLNAPYTAPVVGDPDVGAFQSTDRLVPPTAYLSRAYLAVGSASAIARPNVTSGP